MFTFKWLNFGEAYKDKTQKDVKDFFQIHIFIEICLVSVIEFLC